VMKAQMMEMLVWIRMKDTFRYLRLMLQSDEGIDEDVS
jgi:hypothetical protein